MQSKAVNETLCEMKYETQVHTQASTLAKKMANTLMDTLADPLEKLQAKTIGEILSNVEEKHCLTR